MTSDMKAVLSDMAQGQAPAVETARRAFDLIMDGTATPAQTGAFLMALKLKGETDLDLLAAAEALRAKAVRVKAPPEAMDIVGTGGDKSGSYNVSTAAALIVASLGVPVAKHGNRSITSKSGTADTLAALGVKIDLSAQGVEACLHQAGIGFMLAPRFHPVMRHVASIRQELGTPTIFNLTGPLCNPAHVTRMLTGVYDRRWLEPYGLALSRLGVTRAFIVHGADGLDELSTTGPSDIVSLDHGTISRFTITPGDVGLETVAREDLVGGDADHNARALRAILAGAHNPYRDIAVLNAGAALQVAGRAETLVQGVRLAENALDQGLAGDCLEQLIQVSNEQV
jgi:anthranilate phosphoribosyltransferase